MVNPKTGQAFARTSAMIIGGVVGALVVVDLVGGIINGDDDGDPILYDDQADLRFTHESPMRVEAVDDRWSPDDKVVVDSEVFNAKALRNYREYKAKGWHFSKMVVEQVSYKYFVDDDGWLGEGNPHEISIYLNNQEVSFQAITTTGPETRDITTKRIAFISDFEELVIKVRAMAGCKFLTNNANTTVEEVTVKGRVEMYK